MKLHELLSKRPLPGDVGVELEIEGERLPFYAHQTQDGIRLDDFWKIVTDGSLRGGAEYVLNAPMKLKDLPLAFQKMAEYFKASKTKTCYSFRTSTHVHVNVLDLTYEELLGMILTYLLLEDVLLQFVSERRRGNRFCLSVANAENVGMAINKLIRYRQNPGPFYGMLNQGEMKYSAINLYTLRKYGSLEFRALEGTDDWQKIIDWSTAYVNIREFARKQGSMEAVWNFLNKEGTLRFLQETLGDVYKVFYYKGAEDTVQQSASIHYDTVLTMLNNPKKEEVPAKKKDRYGGIKPDAKFDGHSWEDILRAVDWDLERAAEMADRFLKNQRRRIQLQGGAIPHQQPVAPVIAEFLGRQPEWEQAFARAGAAVPRFAIGEVARPVENEDEDF